MKQVTIKKEDGQVRVDTNLDYLFSTLRNGVYTLTIKRASEKRTVAQNDLMWMWFACIEGETGTAKEDVYNHYCKKFLSKPDPMGEGFINDTSSRLNTKQMTDFMMKIQADAASELGITLPVPDDRYFEAFYQQYNV
ncbi:NinB/YbcN family protein [Prevotella corporis]|uniref:hypothetical protein n=1 Tax=Prevotella corporis TaxID=28128 RepID=UPI00041B05BC|nr:hypothetical protein [Prevotella corporis]